MGAEAPVVIIGAGLAGLACAAELTAAGIEVKVLEASDDVGGRVRTDVIDGFLVDRGFQIILTAYPELHRQFDVKALDLREFAPGALVWRSGRGHVVSDPFRDPRHVLATALAPIGTVFDKARVARLRMQVRRGHPSRLLAGEDISTLEALRGAGFSETMIQRFFRPLVGGIQLDADLGDSRRMFDIVFRMLAEGAAAVPAEGMSAIPRQLAARLEPDSIEFDAPVSAVRPGRVEIAGHSLNARAIVVATEGPTASKLLGLPTVGSKSVGSVWFAAEQAPTETRLVILDGESSGPVLNVAVMTNIARSYAPSDGHVIAASLPGVIDGDLDALARDQLRRWWGSDVDRWQTLAVHRIHHGQPLQRPPFTPKRSVTPSEGIFVCGDHRDTASSQGALFSGRRCAQRVLTSLGHSTTARATDTVS